MTSQPHPSERPHPAPLTYVKVASVLGAITVVEVWAFYVDILHPVLIPMLILLSAAKFSLVAMFFMHLRFESRMFTGLFVSGLLMAAAITVALMSLFGVIGQGGPTLVSAAPQPGGQTPQQTVTQGPTGAQLFVAKGCGACHTISGVPGAAGAIGPQLDGMATRAGARKPPLTAEQYVRESIERPGAFAVEGFPPIMPSLKGTMTDPEFESLVAFLLTLK